MLRDWSKRVSIVNSRYPVDAAAVDKISGNTREMIVTVRLGPEIVFALETKEGLNGGWSGGGGAFVGTRLKFSIFVDCR